jgi:subtilisin family serine protease
LPARHAFLSRRVLVAALHIALLAQVLPPSPIQPTEAATDQAGDQAAAQGQRRAQESAQTTTRIVVRFRPGLGRGARLAAATEAGGEVKRELPQLNAIELEVPKAAAPAMVRAFDRRPDVLSAAPSVAMVVAAEPDDPGFGDQWGLSSIGWPQLYASAAEGRKVSIAVLDTGVDATHPDLAPVVSGGWSALSADGSGATTDPHGHGTFVAGIAAAATNNGTGIAGVAFRDTSLISVQVLPADGIGYDSDVVAGLIWAADSGADVILMAFSSPDRSQLLADAAEYAASKGAVLVAASGNEASPAQSFPAGFGSVIGVAASDPENRLWPGSNTGSAAIAAPGVSVLATSRGGELTRVSGTSAAAAHVAGAAAVLLSHGEPPTGIAAGLISSAQPVEGSTLRRLDLAAAVSGAPGEGAEPTAPASPASSASPAPTPASEPNYQAAVGFNVSNAGRGSGTVTVTTTGLGFTGASGACVNANGIPLLFTTAVCTFDGTGSGSLTGGGNNGTTTAIAARTNGSDFLSWTGATDFGTCANSTSTSCTNNNANATYTLEVRFTNTRTSVDCGNFLYNGVTASCTATVTDLRTSGASNPTGTISWTQSGTATGAFNPTPAGCSLTSVPGSGRDSWCEIDFTPSSNGSKTITASYAGTATMSATSGSSPSFTISGGAPAAGSCLAGSASSICIDGTNVDWDTPRGGAFQDPPTDAGGGSNDIYSVRLFRDATNVYVRWETRLRSNSNKITSDGFSLSIDTTSPFMLAANYRGWVLLNSKGQPTVRMQNVATGTFTTVGAAQQNCNVSLCVPGTVAYLEAAFPLSSIGSPSTAIALQAETRASPSTSANVKDCAPGVGVPCSGWFALASDGSTSISGNSSSTGISCSPNPVTLPAASTCTVTVTDTGPSGASNPSGIVFVANADGWTDSATETDTRFSGNPCTLSPIGGSSPPASSCSLTYTPTAAGTHVLTAYYNGTASHQPSNSSALNVVFNKRSTSTTVSCSPNTLDTAGPTTTTCTATVSDTATGTTSAPSGLVSFSTTSGSGTFSDASCTLSPATGSASTCSVDYTVSGTGTRTVNAAYPESAVHLASDSNGGGGTELTVTGPEEQTITVATPPPASVAYGDTFEVAASGTSGLPVSITVSGPCSITTGGTGSATILMTGASGTCTVHFNQAGNVSWLAAPEADNEAAAARRPITVTAATDSREYDGTTSSSGTPTITAGSLLEGHTATFSQSFDSRHAGTGKAITPNGSVDEGSGGDNYQITFVVVHDGEITPRAITVTAHTDSKAYDGTTTSQGTPTISEGSLVEDDTAAFGQAFDDRNAGSAKTITASGAVQDGNEGANYALTFVAAHGGVIEKADLVARTQDAMREYGDDNPALTATLEGFIDAEDEGELEGSLQCQSPADAASPAGEYEIECSGLTAINYAIAWLPGTLTVEPATLVVSADDVDRPYGDLEATLTYTTTGFKNGEDDSVVAGSASCWTAATAASPAGSYEIDCDLSELSADDYVFVKGPAGTLTISKVSLSVAVADAERAYGATNPEFVVEFSGFVAGEDENVVTGAAVCSTDALPSSPAREYEIECSLGSMASDNYDLGTIASGALAVTPAELTIKAQDKGRLYGQPDPVFTVSYSGFVLDEDDEVLLGELACATDATSASPAGFYTIECSGLSSGNYRIEWLGGVLTIAANSLTVRPVDVARPYGDPNPAFTLQYDGFIGGDDESMLDGEVICSTSAAESSPVGDYEIDCADSTLISSDYAINYEPGTLSVTRRALSVWAVDLERGYGEGKAETTIGYSGFAAGEDASVLSGSPDCDIDADASSPVGSYDIDCSLGSLTADNYTIDAISSGKLSVSSAALTATANDAQQTYGEADPAYSVSLTGFVLGDDESVLEGSLACLVDAPSPAPVGSYEIGCGGFSAANYAITWLPGMLSVQPAPASVETSDETVPFDAADRLVTLSATVSSPELSVGEGTVAFSIERGSSTIASGLAAVSAGQASLALVFPGGTAPGDYTIKALFSDSNFLTAQDVATLTVQVVAPPSSASPSAPPSSSPSAPPSSSPSAPPSSSPSAPPSSSPSPSSAAPSASPRPDSSPASAPASGSPAGGTPTALPDASQPVDTWPTAAPATATPAQSPIAGGSLPGANYGQGATPATAQEDGPGWLSALMIGATSLALFVLGLWLLAGYRRRYQLRLNGEVLSTHITRGRAERAFREHLARQRYTSVRLTEQRRPIALLTDSDGLEHDLAIVDRSRTVRRHVERALPARQS